VKQLKVEKRWGRRICSLGRKVAKGIGGKWGRAKLPMLAQTKDHYKKGLLKGKREIDPGNKRRCVERKRGKKNKRS